MAGLVPRVTSDVPGRVPSTLQLDLGVLGINMADGVLYLKRRDYSTGAEQVLPICSVEALANRPVVGIKTATFHEQHDIAATSGAISVDWSAAQNAKQAAPTATITYTFVDPPGPCHLQLLIAAASTAQTFTWPASVAWFGAVWAQVAGKEAIVNFWFDGTAYRAMGVNEV
jgi:hypothetical protein